MAISSRPDATVKWGSIALYILFAFAISWVIWLGLGALGVSFTIRVAIGMFGPALAAVLVRLIRHEGFADAGLRLVARGRSGAWRMYIAAYIVPPILIALSIGFVMLVGLQHWALPQNMQAMGQGISKALPATIVLAFTFGILFNMIFTFGEEFGWRSYLLLRLAPLGGIPAAIITGIIWGLWHAPLIILNGYNYPGHPILGVIMMVVFTVSLSMIFTWLRFRSGSVWPSTLAHAAVNAQYNYGVLLLSPADSLLRAPIGLVGLIPTIIFAIILAATGLLHPEPDHTGEMAKAIP
ncbi:MAG TPA: CPBP family intramembrane glutamic endopeptidase [Ktedonobacteraceae bacterium]|jgi:membrane protease YdiL (CAAX protease family)|nr:CPBP family intramembrane glutamic endopeptidase [Ktedonobacteraceae bacterium]